MSPVTLSSSNRPIQATTPAGGDLVATGFSGTEALSRPFQFSIDFLSTNFAVAADTLLGKPVTLKILPAESDSPRYIHGLVRRFAALGHTQELAHYRAEIVPSLWFMSLSSDCRTFENKSVTDIVSDVCKAAGVTDLKIKVAAAPAPMPYTVQYRETNLDFVSRLLEEAGLYYTFEHTDSGHTLIISDAVAGSIPAAPTPKVRVGNPKGATEWPANSVMQVAREFSVHAQGVELGNHALLANDASSEAASQDPGVRGERYDFVGTLADPLPQDAAKHRIEIEEGTSAIVRGTSTGRGLQSGTRAKIAGGEFGNDGTEFHIIEVTHRYTATSVFSGQGLDSVYENEFVAIPVGKRFRPVRATQAPVVLGTHAAKVVGAGGTGEIDVDADGRILVEFPWDRGEMKGGKTKHRVHVASSWSGAGWGFMQIPRVGQEVLVEFLDGDVNHPIVTARVYNQVHKPPYALPANKTQSGMMSRTLGGGTDNYNELRFEDKKGEEHVYAQAEKDLNIVVKNDETRDVKHDRITTIKNDDTRTVTEGNDTHTISKGDQTIEVSTGKQETTVAKGDQIVKVSTGKQTITVKGDQSLTVEQGARKTSVKMGDDSLEVAMGNHETTVKLGNITVKASAGAITLEALQKITLKCGPSTIELGPAGITIKGVKVSVEGTAQAEVKAAMVTVQAQAMLQVKGAIAQVNGDGMLMLKGGITMIN